MRASFTARIRTPVCTGFRLRYGWVGSDGSSAGGWALMINVLVADDHAIVRRGLKQILEETSDIVVAAEATTAEEVRTLVRDRTWSLVVLDLRLPGTTGLDLLTALKLERPSLPILVLTASPEDEYAVGAIRAGAAGFLTKESAPERLIEAVRKVASGGRYVSGELAERLASLVSGQAKGPPHERLSERELQVFKMLASGQTVSEVALALSLSVKTISTHRTRILAKMELRTNAELTHYAMKNKLVE